ncbi:hypothetical protein FACS189490_10920 [Clostridia bacterium]|nr:hypothetical protein FACS189490_10920 [Clostridia bacterium]
MNNLVGKPRLFLRRSSPAILSCIGAVGVVATAILAVKATPKAMRLLDMAEREKEEKLTRLEIIKVAAPVYIPAMLTCVATASCIFGANVLNKRNQASLVSAYAMLEQGCKQYRRAANTVFGEDADAKIIAQIAKDTYISGDGFHIYDPDSDNESEKVLFYDAYSQQYFKATIASVLNAQYHVNRNLTLRGDVTVNEFYEFLGLEGVDCGDVTGWAMDELIESGVMWLDFENSHVKMEDGMECYIISALLGPTLLGED